MSPTSKSSASESGAWAKKNGLEILTDFAEKLIFHVGSFDVGSFDVGSFDVDMIGATLKSFPDLVEYVKDMA